ncbi:MAG: DUF4910 domain-containing protein [Sulfitobacter sp.]
MDQFLELARSTVCISRIKQTIEVLCRHDRYQVSHGIVAAAQDLAEALQVRENITATLTTLDADYGGAWDFGMPPSWTPLEAMIELPDGEVFSLAKHPLLLATNSSDLERQDLKVVAYEPGNWLGDGDVLALVDPEDLNLTQLMRDGVAVFATRASFMPNAAGASARGRVELGADSKMTGFSLDRHQFDTLRKLSKQQQKIRAVVKIDHTAKLPLLSWNIPGALPEEVWVMAHMCHQKPGANDNASGVAGLVEVTRCCTEIARDVPAEHRGTIRFFTGPEFTGISAFLEKSIQQRSGFTGPSCVINLDMIGQDSAKNGGMFRVERCPQASRSSLTAVAQRMIADVFDHDGHEWTPMAFKGYSDNSIFAAGPLSCPTVQFCHDKDIYNHTSEDRPERLSFEKIAAVSAAAAATALVMAVQTDLAKEYRLGLFDAWAMDQPNGFAKIVFDAKRQNGFLKGPLNLRGLLQHVTPESRQAYVEALSANKETYAALLNSIIYADQGLSTADAIDAAASCLGKVFCEDTIALLTQIVEQIRRH